VKLPRFYQNQWSRRPLVRNKRVAHWPNRDQLGERGGVNVYAFIGNKPISRFDKLGLFQLICDKCKEGNLRQVKVTDWGLIPILSQGNPNTVSSAKSALDGSETVGTVSDIGGIATAGVSVAELAEKVAELSKSAADAGTGQGMTLGWTEKMTHKIETIQKNLGKQEGVYIDIQVSWQKCQQIKWGAWSDGSGGLFGTSHLDWVAHSSWYINKDAGTSGVGGEGFGPDDAVNITKAIFPSIVAALQNTAY